MDETEPMLWTRSRLAREFGVSVKTLERWQREGTGPPPVRLTDGSVRYFADEARQYAQGLRRVQTEPA